MTETAMSQNIDTNNPDSPGKALLAQREKLNLSAQEIAKRIHLDIKIIEAIEADDYTNMPTATYVRGYLRSYAKTVGFDADKVIELYNSDSPPPPPDILPEVKQPSQVSSSDKPVKAFTYLITLGLVLLLLIWYQSNFVVEKPAEVQPVKETPSMINNTDTTYKIVVHPEGWQTPVSTTTETMDEGIKTEEQSTPPATQENEVDKLELQTDNGDEAIGILPIYDSATSSNSSGPDSIVLDIKKDSWIEIYDRDNKRLLMDLARAGEHYEIRGKAPFNVKFGFSEGVVMKFNGKPFDQVPYSSNGVARFKLPPE